MSLVRPFSSISPKGLLVSGHLKNVNRPFLEAPDQAGAHGRVRGGGLHHTDVVDKLQRE